VTRDSSRYCFLPLRPRSQQSRCQPRMVSHCVNSFWQHTQNLTWASPGMYFDIRTRALNSFLYTAAQLLGCLVLSFSLDYRGGDSPKRHQLIVTTGVVLCTVACWVTLLLWHIRYSRTAGLQGWESHGYGLACTAMILHGLNLSIVSIELTSPDSRANND